MRATQARRARARRPLILVFLLSLAQLSVAEAGHRRRGARSRATQTSANAWRARRGALQARQSLGSPAEALLKAVGSPRTTTRSAAQLSGGGFSSPSGQAHTSHRLAAAPRRLAAPGDAGRPVGFDGIAGCVGARSPGMRSTPSRGTAVANRREWVGRTTEARVTNITVATAIGVVPKFEGAEMGVASALRRWPVGRLPCSGP